MKFKTYVWISTLYYISVVYGVSFISSQYNDWYIGPTVFILVGASIVKLVADFAILLDYFMMLDFMQLSYRFIDKWFYDLR